MSLSLSGWQAIVGLLIGASTATTGVILGPPGAPLVALGSAIVGGILGVSQPWRSPQARTRAGDRPDPDKTPREGLRR